MAHTCCFGDDDINNVVPRTALTAPQKRQHRDYETLLKPFHGVSYINIYTRVVVFSFGRVGGFWALGLP